jgi:inorganic pyrophosphatase
VARLSPGSARGDGDPLDICVLSERPINRNEVLVKARVLGGLQMVDAGEADDKIVAVLDNDYVYEDARDIADLPTVLVERLQHYFLTYKLVPGKPGTSTIREVYGHAHAVKVIRAAMADYTEAFGA